MFELSAMHLALIPLIVAMVQLIKTSLGLESRYAPFIALAFGVAIAFLTGTGSVGENIIIGLVLGLTASGGYSQYKAQLPTA